MNQINFTNDKMIFILPMILMLLDIASGIISAIYKHKLKSTKIRQGFFKKSGEILIIVFIYVLVKMAGISILVAETSSLILCGSEIISFFENIKTLGAKTPKPLENIIPLKETIEGEEHDE